MSKASRAGTISPMSGKRWWAAEVALRIFGLVLLALCTAAVVWLYGLVHQPPPHEADASELFAAFLAVFGWCLGWPFLLVGQGLFKLVRVPGWRGIRLR